MDSEEFYNSLHLDDPEWDRIWMECNRHASCIDAQNQAEFLYETLSGYAPTELDEEQNRFVRWVEALAP